MELPDELIAALEELKKKLQSAVGGSPEELIRALDSAGEIPTVDTPSRQSWMDRLSAWLRRLKRKASAAWDRAAQAVKRFVQSLAAKVAKLAGQNNRDWIIAGLVLVTAVAVVMATVKSFALIVALLAAFGLLALVRIIQRLQNGLVL